MDAEAGFVVPGSQVLIVDNDPAFVGMVQAALTRRKFTTLTAHDGLQALEIARERRLDCVVLDLILPKVGGDALIRYLQEDSALCRVPVVLVSGALPEGRSFLPELNVQALIPKGPLEPTIGKIVSAVEALISLPGSTPGSRPSRPADREDRPGSRSMVVELLETRRHYEQIFQALGEGVVEVDADSRIVFVNPAAEQMLGAEWASLMGADFLTAVPAEDAQLVRRLIRGFAEGGVFSSVPLAFTRTGRTLRARLTPLFDSGVYSGAVVTFSDATSEWTRDRHRSLLLAYLAHELKNALSLMGGQVGLLTKGREREFALTREEILAHVTRETARLLRLVADISRLNRTQAALFRLTLEPVDLAIAVAESLGGIRVRLQRKRITLVLDVSPALPPVMASKDHLIQALENLLMNALRATTAGGRITISARGEGDMARVSIRDTGPGMPPEVVERVLARQPEDLPGLDFAVGRRGVGLGLLITRGIVDALGGELSIQSHPNEGTIVGFSLGWAPFSRVRPPRRA